MTPQSKSQLSNRFRLALAVLLLLLLLITLHHDPQRDLW